MHITLKLGGMGIEFNVYHYQPTIPGDWDNPDEPVEIEWEVVDNKGADAIIAEFELWEEIDERLLKIIEGR